MDPHTPDKPLPIAILDIPPPPAHLLSPTPAPPSPPETTPDNHTLPAAIAQDPAPPSVAEQLQTEITAAAYDTVLKLDLRAYLEQLARTEPRTFRSWVEMCLPKSPGGKVQNATIVNVHSALPKSALDVLPDGFDLHR